jgi:N-acetylglucosamine kinase-like BadF-type ATPase
VAARPTTDPLLVGVDAGTTNTEAVVFDAAGNVVAVYERLYREVYLPLAPTVRRVHDALAHLLDDVPQR